METRASSLQMWLINLQKVSFEQIFQYQECKRHDYFKKCGREKSFNFMAQIMEFILNLLLIRGKFITTKAAATLHEAIKKCLEYKKKFTTDYTGGTQTIVPFNMLDFINQKASEYKCEGSNLVVTSEVSFDLYEELRRQKEVLLHMEGVSASMQPNVQTLKKISKNMQKIDDLSRQQHLHTIPELLYKEKTIKEHVQNHENLVDNLHAIVKSQEFLFKNMVKLIGILEKNDVLRTNQNLEQIKKKLLACTDVLTNNCPSRRFSSILNNIIEEEITRCRFKTGECKTSAEISLKTSKPEGVQIALEPKKNKKITSTKQTNKVIHNMRRDRGRKNRVEVEVKTNLHNYLKRSESDPGITTISRRKEEKFMSSKEFEDFLKQTRVDIENSTKLIEVSEQQFEQFENQLWHTMTTAKFLSLKDEYMNLCKCAFYNKRQFIATESAIAKRMRQEIEAKNFQKLIDMSNSMFKVIEGKIVVERVRKLESRPKSAPATKNRVSTLRQSQKNSKLPKSDQEKSPSSEKVEQNIKVAKSVHEKAPGSENVINVERQNIKLAKSVQEKSSSTDKVEQNLKVAKSVHDKTPTFENVIDVEQQNIKVATSVQEKAPVSENLINLEQQNLKVGQSLQEKTAVSKNLTNVEQQNLEVGKNVQDKNPVSENLTNVEQQTATNQQTISEQPIKLVADKKADSQFENNFPKPKNFNEKASPTPPDIFIPQLVQTWSDTSWRPTSVAKSVPKDKVHEHPQQKPVAEEKFSSYTLRKRRKINPVPEEQVDSTKKLAQKIQPVSRNSVILRRSKTNWQQKGLINPVTNEKFPPTSHKKSSKINPIPEEIEDSERLSKASLPKIHTVSEKTKPIIVQAQSETSCHQRRFEKPISPSTIKSVAKDLTESAQTNKSSISTKNPIENSDQQKTTSSMKKETVEAQKDFKWGTIVLRPIEPLFSNKSDSKTPKTITATKENQTEKVRPIFSESQTPNMIEDKKIVSERVKDSLIKSTVPLQITPKNKESLKTPRDQTNVLEKTKQVPFVVVNSYKISNNHIQVQKNIKSSNAQDKPLKNTKEKSSTLRGIFSESNLRNKIQNKQKLRRKNMVEQKQGRSKSDELRPDEPKKDIQKCKKLSLHLNNIDKTKITNEKLEKTEREELEKNKSDELGSRQSKEEKEESKKLIQQMNNPEKTNKEVLKNDKTESTAAATTAKSEKMPAELPKLRHYVPESKHSSRNTWKNVLENITPISVKIDTTKSKNNNVHKEKSPKAVEATLKREERRAISEILEKHTGVSAIDDTETEPKVVINATLTEEGKKQEKCTKLLTLVNDSGKVVTVTDDTKTTDSKSVSMLELNREADRINVNEKAFQELETTIRTVKIFIEKNSRSPTFRTTTENKKRKIDEPVKKSMSTNHLVGRSVFNRHVKEDSKVTEVVGHNIIDKCRLYTEVKQATKTFKSSNQNSISSQTINDQKRTQSTVEHFDISGTKSNSQMRRTTKNAMKRQQVVTIFPKISKKTEEKKKLQVTLLETPEMKVAKIKSTHQTEKKMAGVKSTNETNLGSVSKTNNPRRALCNSSSPVIKPSSGKIHCIKWEENEDPEIVKVLKS